uniref:PPM-type phosphatase domain-containing protein n=1 Tax=Dendroctonus ponderosae TaxID=77166 RepID=A0AAR5PDM1_DENPD
MPSLRKRVSTYLRQLSFHNEPREKKNNVNENAFVTKYLQGHISLQEGPPIIYGKTPTDLPNYELAKYESGTNTVVGCYSGPNGGLTTVKRTEKHLSVPDDDIDFIDNPEEEEHLPPPMPKISPKRVSGQPIDNTTMVIKVAGNEYCVTNKPKRHSKSFSLGSISDFNIEVEKTKIDKDFYNCDNKKDSNSNNHHSQCIENQIQCDTSERLEEGCEDDSTENQQFAIDDASLPAEWTRKSDCFYGVSDSLYDRNQVTKQKNGDPIADCFGLITRNDSAILAVADGVNWGEKASIAAKSAIHASLHYLNKTIFNDTKPFEKLTTKTDDVALSSDALSTDETTNLIANTREVFVCLLRAFNCAHDLILENQGMLTTLTVAVILPLNETRSQRHENGIHSNNRKSHYVCCVCNVGDTLAYVYSQKSGIRELTKGSHDVNSNRDMRDALGALGPVDGINPELSNLTLSITTLNEGDIVLVASDGLTDNFDPNVCRFTVNTVNSKADVTKNRVQNTSSSGVAPSHLPNSQLQGNARLLEGRTQPSSVNSQRAEGVISQKPPIKPPRRSKNRGSISSASQSERSASSVEKDNVPISEAPNQGYVNKNLAAVKTKDLTEMENPLVAHFVKENSPGDHRTVKSEVKKQRAVIDNKASSLRKQVSTQNRTELDRKVPPAVKANPNTLDSSFAKQKTQTHKFLKSKTSLDLRSSHQNKIQIPRNVDGIPFVTPYQRYELQLLLMEDILKNGISGNDSPITTAKRLCENLVSFTMSITSAKRRTLEDQDMYFDHRNGVLVEVSNQEKKLRRKKGLEKVQSLPGKLDHVTVVAYNVGNVAI